MGLSMHDQRILAEIERQLVSEDARLDRSLKDFRPHPAHDGRLLVWALLVVSVLFLAAAVVVRSGLLIVPAVSAALVAAFPPARHRRGG